MAVGFFVFFIRSGNTVRPVSPRTGVTCAFEDAPA
jgi:hypothetical protein